MIYAHAHDRTVAKHYFTAMEKVEHEPNIIPELQELPSQKSKQTELLGLIERLEQPELDVEERLEITAQIRRSLLVKTP